MRASRPGVRLALGLFTAGTVLLAVTSVPAGEAAEGPVQVSATARGQTAATTVDGCPASLELEGSDSGLYLRYRNDCDQPTEEKLALLARLAQPVLEGRTLDGPVTLFIGRVVRTLPAMALQGAQAAAAGDWDPAKARTESGYANAWLAEALAATPAAAQLEAVFAPWRLEILSVSVEKVLAAPPQETPFAAELAGAGPVPYDALTHFRLQPRPQ